MGLVHRRRGDAAAAPDGSLARMQFSPYRVQLAGIQTAAVEYRPLAYEVVAGGFIEFRPSDDSASPTGGPAGTGRPRVVAEIYEKDRALLRDGQGAEVSGDAFPGLTPIAGLIRIPAPRSAASKERPRIEVDFDQPRPELRPGAVATVRVRVPAAGLDWLRRALDDEWCNRAVAASVARALAAPPGHLPVASPEQLVRAAGSYALQSRGLVRAVPDAAVIDTGTLQVAYVESGPGMFEAVPVVAGPRCGEFRPVLRGLEAGQRVAATGAFLLDAETRLNPSAAVSYFGAARPAGPAKAVDAEVARALAPLSAADRALAVRQKTCPVSGGALGSMGTPVRVKIGGRTVFLCCQGCEPSLRENAARHLSRLPVP
jgi:hypothetical protein